MLHVRVHFCEAKMPTLHYPLWTPHLCASTEQINILGTIIQIILHAVDITLAYDL